ncbi:MAG: thioredoxin family protein [Acidiferrobacteraceae bacterium]
MEVRLLVSKWCPVCPQAEEIWNQVAQQHPLDYKAIDITDPAGRELVSNLRIKTVPALVIDGKLRAVGVQSFGDAIKMVNEVAKP